MLPTLPLFRRCAGMVALCLFGAVAAQEPVAESEATADDERSYPYDIPGELVTEDMLGESRVVDVLALHELQKTLPPEDGTVRRMRNDAHGQWVVPGMDTTTYPHSGDYYVANRYGDTHMGIGFGRVVHLEGAWVAGQDNPAVWTDGLRVVGYREGREVASTEWFTDVDETPTWFPIDLAGVDRVVFQARPVVAGAGWYGLDDLTYTPFTGPDAQRVVLDFEDLQQKYALTGSGYAGLIWEEGFGTFDEARVIEQPLTPPGFGQEIPLGDEIPPPLGGSGTPPTLVQSFIGSRMFDPGAGFIPPDTVGFAGIDHFAECVNTNFSVYSKTTGARVVNITLNSLFGTTGSPGDPRVLFDTHSQRWFVIATNFSNRIYLAVSRTPDPTGTFFTTSFNPIAGVDAGKFPDYPTMGVDQNGLYFGVAMFGGSTTKTVFALDKAPLIASPPSLGTVTAFRGIAWQGAIQPCVTYGTPGVEYLIGRRSSTSLSLFRVSPPLTSPSFTDLGNVSVPSNSTPPDAPALGSSVPLDSVDHRPMNAVYRNGSIWTAHAVAVSGRSAARWYEIDAVAQSTVQVGTVSDSSLYFIMPSIAVNGDGDAVIAFTGSDSSQYAATYFAGRVSTDPSGQMSAPILYKAGEGAYERVDGAGRNRWGDYSLTCVDPTDDGRFWTVQEYARTSNQWGTYIAELDHDTFTDCNGNGIDDAQDIASGTSEDCDGDGVPDECQPDCDGDGTPDACEADCDGDGVPDECETGGDCDGDGLPDECEPDCDGDGIPDDCEPDCDADGLPDDCEVDCNDNGIPDDCEGLPDCDGDGTPDECEPDCDADGIPDDCESGDCDSDGIPDDCEPDCDGDGTPDDCEGGDDCDGDGLPDECEADCNENGIPDDCEFFIDCNENGIPDECEEPDCDGDDVPDECEPDCDSDGTPDDCESDCDGDGIPDDCDLFADCDGDGVPDDCEPDCDGDGTPDDCESDSDGDGIPDDCECSAANYCVGAPNSVGPGAVIAVSGSLSVADNDFHLHTAGNPVGQFGLFFFGSTQIQIPFGNGFRCVGGGVFRLLPPQITDAFGEVSRTVDFTSAPAAGLITGGSTWNFQFWYRDPDDGGAAFNLSDGVSVLFCD